MNPYAHPARASKLMRARRTPHKADESDGDDDFDMEAFPHLPGLSGYATRSQERMRRTPGSDESKASSGKSKEAIKAPRPQRAVGDSQAYLGPAIAKMSSGLEDRDRKARPAHLQQRPQTYKLNPKPSPTQSTKLLQSIPADFENTSLDKKAVREPDPVSPVSDSIKSDSTIKARPISYQEDYSAIPSPAVLMSSTAEFTPTRDNTVLHHRESDRRRQSPPPIIMINDDVNDAMHGERVVSENTNYLPYPPLVNIGREAGAGDINEMAVFEPREAGNLAGRYYNVGRAV